MPRSIRKTWHSREDVCYETEHDGQDVRADGMEVCLDELLTAWSDIGRQEEQTSVLPTLVERQQDKRREEEEPQVRGRQSS